MCSQKCSLLALVLVVLWCQVGNSQIHCTPPILQLILFCGFIAGHALQVTLQCDKQIVLGATLKCNAQIKEDNGEPATGSFQYQWEDNAIPQHSKLVRLCLTR